MVLHRRQQGGMATGTIASTDKEDTSRGINGGADHGSISA
jgi:hypothetical protein